jgi:hypothetical protein
MSGRLAARLEPVLSALRSRQVAAVAEMPEIHSLDIPDPNSAGVEKTVRALPGR